MPAHRDENWTLFDVVAYGTDAGLARTLANTLAHELARWIPMLLDEMRRPGAASSSRAPPDSCLDQMLFFGVSRHVESGGAANVEISFQHARSNDSSVTIRDAVYIPVRGCSCAARRGKMAALYLVPCMFCGCICGCICLPNVLRTRVGPSSNAGSRWTAAEYPQMAAASARIPDAQRAPAADDGTLPWNSLSCVLAGTLNQWKSLPEEAPDSTVSQLRTVLRDMLYEAHMGMQRSAALHNPLRFDIGLRAQVAGLQS